MKRILILIYIFCFVLPIPEKDWLGVTNNVSGWYWCTTEFSCLHEYAHFLDMSSGWELGKSEKFKNALYVYVISEIRMRGDDPENKAYEIMANLGQPMKEVYADVYATFDGDVPASLKPFYPTFPQDFWHVKMPKGDLYVPISF